MGLPESRVLEAHAEADSERTCLTCVHFLKGGFERTPLDGFVRCTKDELRRREGVELDASDERGWLVIEDTGTRGARSALPTYWIREDAADSDTAEDCDDYQAHPAIAAAADTRRRRQARPVSGPPLVVDEVKPAGGDAGIPDGPPMTRAQIVALGFESAFVSRMVKYGHLVPAECAAHGDTRDCTRSCASVSVAYTRESVRSVARSYKAARRSK